MTHAVAASKLKKAEIAYGTLNDLQGLSTHSELRRTKISNPDTEIKIPAPPAICDKKPLVMLGGVPELNQHGEAIRAEFTETVSLKED
jgi:itaconate CoA-transferase